MNPRYEQQLEATVRRELEGLGELAAPPALAERIMKSVGQRKPLPWYRRSWQTWPPAPRFATMILLMLAFAGICVCVQHGLNSAGGELSGWLKGFSAVWTTVCVLFKTLASLISRVSTLTILICISIFFMACAMSIGLGTAYVKLALRLSINETKS